MRIFQDCEKGLLVDLVLKLKLQVCVLVLRPYSGYSHGDKSLIWDLETRILDKESRFRISIDINLALDAMKG